MRAKWYLPGPVHQHVFDFLRLHCQMSAQFEEFVLRTEEKQKSSNLMEPGLLKLGFVSKQQLLTYLSEVSGGAGISTGNQLARIYDALIYWDVFSEIPIGFSGMRFDFRINFDLVKYYQATRVLENIVKGPGILLSRYYPATAAIIVEKNNQESIGSGAVVSWNERTFVLTNKHVINPNEGIAIKSIFLAESEYQPPHSVILSDADDLAAFPILLPDAHPRFFLGPESYTLQDVVLLGFPKIPLTIRPHFTAHSGEINATIDTRNGEMLYLISNYASPGSSGGPLIDYRGFLIGVVSDSLEAEYEESAMPFQHSAAVTRERVQAFLQEKLSG